MVVGKVVAAVIGAVATIAIIAVVSYYGGIFSNNVHASYQKRVVTAQVQQKVRTADFAQATYERFFKDCNDVVAMNAQIATAERRVKNLQGLPDDAFGTKSQKVGDAISDLAGLQQAQVTVAAEYNASAAEYTRGQFKDQNLPATLDPPFNYQCK